MNNSKLLYQFFKQLQTVHTNIGPQEFSPLGGGRLPTAGLGRCIILKQSLVFTLCPSPPWRGDFLSSRWANKEDHGTIPAAMNSKRELFGWKERREVGRPGTRNGHVLALQEAPDWIKFATSLHEYWFRFVSSQIHRFQRIGISHWQSASGRP